MRRVLNLDLEGIESWAITCDIYITPEEIEEISQLIHNYREEVFHDLTIDSFLQEDKKTKHNQSRKEFVDSALKDLYSFIGKSGNRNAKPAVALKAVELVTEAVSLIEANREEFAPPDLRQLKIYPSSTKLINTLKKMFKRHDVPEEKLDEIINYIELDMNKVAKKMQELREEELAQEAALQNLI